MNPRRSDLKTLRTDVHYSVTRSLWHIALCETAVFTLNQTNKVIESFNRFLISRQTGISLHGIKKRNK